jgi:hypothetical protein
MLRHLWENKALLGAVGAGLVAAGFALSGDYKHALTAATTALGLLGVHSHLIDVLTAGVAAEEMSPEEKK